MPHGNKWPPPWTWVRPGMQRAPPPKGREGSIGNLLHCWNIFSPFHACCLLLDTRRTASGFSDGVMRTQWHLVAGPKLNISVINQIKLARFVSHGSVLCLAYCSDKDLGLLADLRRPKIQVSNRVFVQNTFLVYKALST